MRGQPAADAGSTLVLADRAQGDGGVRTRAISKKFGSVVALNDVDVEFRFGEIHGLVGQNGAGKTTLASIIFGLQRPDLGELLVRGETVHLLSPRDALALGIGMVQQRFALSPDLTVAENVKLGERITLEGLRVGPGEWEGEVDELAASCGLEIAPRARVGELPYSMQQRVAILRALGTGSDFLILDEPTTNLTPDQVVELFELLYALVRAGKGVLLITHKISEVLDATSRLTVLRDGEVAAKLQTKGTTYQEIADAMIGGHSTSPMRRSRTTVGTESMLELRSLVLRSDAAHRPSIDLDVRRGEILGIAGVAGNGQTELAETISGIRQPESGEILLDRGSITGLGPGEVAGRGVGYVPEDRNRTATTPSLTIAEALTLKGLRTPEVRRHTLLRRGFMAKRAQEAIAAFDIKPPHPQVRCGQLSGGNLQKVVLARELAVARRLLIAVQPTQGLDIGARDFVHEQLRDRVADGMSLILISTELDEVLALSHRIAVIYRFGVIGIVNAEEATTEKVGRLMGGVTDD